MCVEIKCLLMIALERSGHRGRSGLCFSFAWKFLFVSLGERPLLCRIEERANVIRVWLDSRERAVPSQ